MKYKFILIAAYAVASSASASSANCLSIKTDKARLACYDKAAKDPAKADVSAPVAQSAPAAVPLPQSVAPAMKKDGEVFASGKWHVIQKQDAMTDRKNCTALYEGAWTIQGNPGKLYVSFKGRGGIKAYQLRVDDAPADELRLATEMEGKISAADLSHSYDRIYESKRVRLQTMTILGSTLIEDIDMNGYKESIQYMIANCGSHT